MTDTAKGIIKKPKVLIFIKGFGLGGAERLIVDALPHIDRQRFDHEYAYLLAHKNFLVPEIAKQGFAVHCLNMKNPLYFYFAVSRLRKIMKERGVSLVHAHLPVPGIIARLAARPLGIPVVYTEHSMQEEFHFLTRLLNRLTYGLNKCAIAVSREVFSSMERNGLVKKTKSYIIENGICAEKVREEAKDIDGLRRELGLVAGKKVIGAVAVFRPVKNLGQWIETAAEVLKKRDDVVFLLVGHGPQKKLLEQKIEKLGLAGRVIMPGFRPDGRRLIAAMDIYLMTSFHEGMPLTILEAMSLGVPVVSFKTGGIPEIVTDGSDGFLIKPGDTGGLSAAIERLVSDDSLRKNMGQSGIMKIEKRMHLKYGIEKTERIYAEELGKAARWA